MTAVTEFGCSAGSVSWLTMTVVTEFGCWAGSVLQYNTNSSHWVWVLSRKCFTDSGHWVCVLSKKCFRSSVSWYGSSHSLAMLQQGRKFHGMAAVTVWQGYMKTVFHGMAAVTVWQGYMKTVFHGMTAVTVWHGYMKKECFMVWQQSQFDQATWRVFHGMAAVTVWQGYRKKRVPWYDSSHSLTRLQEEESFMVWQQSQFGSATQRLQFGNVSL